MRNAAQQNRQTAHPTNGLSDSFASAIRRRSDHVDVLSLVFVTIEQSPFFNFSFTVYSSSKSPFIINPVQRIQHKKILNCLCEKCSKYFCVIRFRELPTKFCYISSIRLHIRPNNNVARVSTIKTGKWKS